MSYKTVLDVNVCNLLHEWCLLFTKDKSAFNEIHPRIFPDEFLVCGSRIILLLCFQMQSVDGTPIGQFLVSKNDEKVRHLKCQSDQVGFC